MNSEYHEIGRVEPIDRLTAVNSQLIDLQCEVASVSLRHRNTSSATTRRQLDNTLVGLTDNICARIDSLEPDEWLVIYTEAIDIQESYVSDEAEQLHENFPWVLTKGLDERPLVQSFIPRSLIKDIGRRYDFDGKSPVVGLSLECSTADDLDGTRNIGVPLSLYGLEMWSEDQVAGMLADELNLE